MRYRPPKIKIWCSVLVRQVLWSQVKQDPLHPRCFKDSKQIGGKKPRNAGRLEEKISNFMDFQVAIQVIWMWLLLLRWWATFKQTLRVSAIFHHNWISRPQTNQKYLKMILVTKKSNKLFPSGLCEDLSRLGYRDTPNLKIMKLYLSFVVFHTKELHEPADVAYDGLLELGSL